MLPDEIDVEFGLDYDAPTLDLFGLDALGPPLAAPELDTFADDWES